MSRPFFVANVRFIKKLHGWMVLQLGLHPELVVYSLSELSQATLYIMDAVVADSYEIQFVIRPESTHARAYASIAHLLASETQVRFEQRARAHQMHRLRYIAQHARAHQCPGYEPVPD